MNQINQPQAQKGREWLRIQPDKQYGLGYVDSRFEVPVDMPPDPQLIEAAGAPVVAKTIEQFERLSGWQFYDQIPVKYFLSALPTRDQLDNFNSLKKDETVGAVDAWAKPAIVLYARIWFIRPMDVIENSSKELGEEDGFVSIEDMPEGSLK